MTGPRRSSILASAGTADFHGCGGIVDHPRGNTEITIALLTRNAGLLLDRVLSGIAAQEISCGVEVLAIDSGSTDGTPDRLRGAGARINSIEAGEFDFGRSRDLAYQQARGAIVVNLSQDAVPAHSHWLEHLVAPLGAPDVAISCGASVPDPERGGGQFAWERNGWFYFTREMQKFRRAHGRGVSFANSAVRRDVWEWLRFEPQALGEDFQFQMKVQCEGLSVAFPPDAEVLHHHDYDLLGLWGRCRNEGLALKQMGFAYTVGDLARDLASPAKFIQLARELRHGRLRSNAEVLFPCLRPIAVFAGSSFGRAYRAYAHRAEEAA